MSPRAKAMGNEQMSSCLDRMLAAEEALAAARKAIKEAMDDDAELKAAALQVSSAWANVPKEEDSWQIQDISNPPAPSPVNPEAPRAALLGQKLKGVSERSSVDHVLLIPVKHRLNSIDAAQLLEKSATFKEEDPQISRSMTKARPADAWYYNPASADANAKSHILKDVSWQPLCGPLQVPVLSPESTYRFAWLSLGVFLNIFEAMAIPVYLSFEYTPAGWLWHLTNMINAYFLIDIPVQFMTGYTTQKGVIIFSLKKIAIRYARTWFIIDSAAAIPWEWFYGQHQSGPAAAVGTRSARLIRLVRILRLMRLLRLVKMQELSANVEQFVESSRVAVFALEMSRLLFALGLVVHWGACMWHGVGTRQVDEGYDTWLTFYELADHTGLDRYCWSLYFTLTTMSTVGFGDITPKGQFEVVVAIVLLIISTLVFSSLMGVLMELIGNLRRNARNLADRRIALARYMRWRSLPQSVIIKIRQYMMFQWDRQEGYDTYEKEIRQKLPPILQSELCYQIFGKAISDAPFMAWMCNYDVCMKTLSGLANSLLLEREDYLFKKGDTNVSIYFLVDGLVRISQNSTVRETFKSVKQGGTMQLSRQKAMSERVKNSVSFGEDDIPNDSPTQPLTNRAFTYALRELLSQDAAELEAARILQRRYREKLMRRAVSAMTSRKMLPTRPSKQVSSSTLSAPIYFGESCLWTPYKEWSNPEYITRHAYGARAVTRGEAVVLRRDAFRQVIEGNSPWLLNRFEMFSAAVVQTMGEMMHDEIDEGTKLMSADTSLEEEGEETTPALPNGKLHLAPEDCIDDTRTSLPGMV